MPSVPCSGSHAHRIWNRLAPLGLAALLCPAVAAAAPAGLIGHWSFDASHRTATQVLDLSTNANHGTLHNVSFVPGPAGKGEAASFNGVDSDIEIPDPQNLFSGTAGLTVSFWLRKSDYQAAEVYLSKVGLWGPFSFRKWQRAAEVRPYLCGAAGNSPQAEASPLPLGFYINYTFTYDGATCRQYIDGHRVRENPCPAGPLVSSGGTLLVGKGSENYGFLHGELDELMIFNRALPKEELPGALGCGYCGDSLCGPSETSLVCPEDCLRTDLVTLLLEDPSLRVWGVDLAQKILPGHVPPAQGRAGQLLALARNETRSVQLALRAAAAGDRALEVTATDGLEVALYVEELVPITIPSAHNTLPFTGTIPDPLRRSSTVMLHQDTTRAVLVEVTATPAATPGLHTIVVRIAGHEVPVGVRVYDFALPETPSLRTAFDSGHFDSKYTGRSGCVARSVANFHGLAKAADGPLVQTYYEDYARHRVAPYRAFWGQALAYDCAKRAFDFSGLDAALEHYLDELHMASVIIQHFTGSAYGSGYPLCGLAITDPGYAAEAIAYYSQLAAHLAAKGWLEKAFIMVDEPSGVDLERTRELAKIVTQQVTPPLHIGPAFYQPEAYDVMNGAGNVWVINNNERGGLFRPDFAATHALQGEAIWWYYTRSAIFDIDAEAVDHLGFAWSAWRFRIQGVLMWAGLIFDNHCSTSGSYLLENPWIDPRCDWGNGQINLYYPPCGAGLCPTPTYELVPSLRLKLIREAVADHSYLTLLEATIAEARQRGLDTAAAGETLAKVELVAPSFDAWTRDPVALVGLRREVAGAIELLRALLRHPAADGTPMTGPLDAGPRDAGASERGSAANVDGCGCTNAPGTGAPGLLALCLFTAIGILRRLARGAGRGRGQGRV